jgi:hypothetical protein
MSIYQRESLVVKENIRGAKFSTAHRDPYLGLLSVRRDDFRYSFFIAATLAVTRGSLARHARSRCDGNYVREFHDEQKPFEILL